MRAPWKKLKVGVALGGGAARGLAHIGVLRALVREGIPIDVLAGTSMGSVIGGAYAAIGDIAVVESRVREFVQSEAFKKNRISFLKETKQERGGLLYSVANLIRRGIVYGVSTVRSSFMSAEEFAKSMSAVLPDIDMRELKIPFVAIALDLEAAEEVVLSTGRLRETVMASSAIPGFLPPVRLNNRVLVDGGWIDKVPVLPAYHRGADVVIAIDISADIQDTEDYTRGVDVMFRATAIKDGMLVRFLSRMADVVIEPAVGQVHWADFGAVEYCIQAGDDATTAAVPRIRALLQRERWLSLFRQRPTKRAAQIYLSSDHMNLCVE
ncbi:MAG: patatin-like phospholipase family protein [Acidobacteriota bacterium]|nr:patatin-like phospholipase family protein [Acidobacteriota bacterium]